MSYFLTLIYSVGKKVKNRSRIFSLADHTVVNLIGLNFLFRWSHAERLLAIDQLIDTCEPQQVRHMMQVYKVFKKT